MSGSAVARGLAGADWRHNLLVRCNRVAYIVTMAHHKRKGPKSTRAGCLLCKPFKRQGAPKKGRQAFSLWRRIRAMERDLKEHVR